MCGIFGIISCDTSVPTGPGFIKDAFIAGSVRGVDSSGILQIQASGALRTQRLAVNGSLFVKDTQAGRIIDDADSAYATFGHNRSATSGGLGPAVAHPFSFYERGTLVFAGMHNGTLNWWDKANTLYRSDTEWALAQIKDKGIKALREMDGAFVFVWCNPVENDRVINIVRNKERPLFLATSPNYKTLMFASEAGMLYWLAERNGLKIKEDKVYNLEEDCVYSIPVDDPVHFTKVRITPMTAKEQKALKASRPAMPTTTTTTTTPPATSPTSYMDYHEKTKQSVVAKLLTAIGVTGFNPAGDAPVTHLVPVPKSPTSDDTSITTPGAKQCAKDLGLYLNEVTFFPTVAGGSVNDTIHGSVMVPVTDILTKKATYEEVWSEIRSVNTELWEAIRKSTTLTCKIIGVERILPTGDFAPENLCYTLSKPIYFNYKDGSRMNRRSGKIIPPSTGEGEDVPGSDDEDGEICLTGCGSN